MTVKSVYNFVPAPEEKYVFTPPWADKVSHDIPFKDGKSGEISIKITAKTPIFIRNGHSKKEKEIYDEIVRKENAQKNYKLTEEEKKIRSKYLSFSHFEKKNNQKEYFIPATSLKGMIRNTLEIFSFSRLNHNLVDNHRYSYRDLHSAYYLQNYDAKSIKAGWLTQNENGEWIIKECKFKQIHHETIDEKLKEQYKDGFEGFRNKFLEKSNLEKDKITIKENEKTAKWKYEQLKNLESLNITYKGKKGCLVFTGQPGKRQEYKKDENGKIKPSGKVKEFVFYECKKDDVKPDEFSEDVQKDFRFTYSEHDSNNISPDWKYWKEKLESNDRVPVFFKSENGKIKHLGLSYMYKLPYKYSIHDLSPIKTYPMEENLKPDLATTMFGRIGDDALKGRVYFGHAFLNEEIKKNQEIKKKILASPKASFYPFYLKDGNYDKETNVLRGFKKYPVHKSIPEDESNDENTNYKLYSSFKPLAEGSQFTAKIRFHNLRKIGIGALLSALTFHNNEENDKYLHTLGGAKPFGYGSVKIDVTKLIFFEDGETYTDTVAKYISEFESYMDYFCRVKTKYNGWVDAYPIRAYFELSNSKKPDEYYNKFRYPRLQPPRNEFKDYKELPQVDVSDIQIQSNKDKVLEEKYKEWTEKFNKIKDKGIDKWEEFIGLYPDSMESLVIQQKINSYFLYSGTIEDIEEFIKKNPNTPIYEQLQKRLIDLKFNLMLECNDIDKIKNFIDKDIKEQEKKSLLEQRISELECTKRYKSIKDSTDLNILTQFLEDCINQEYRKNINIRIQYLEREIKKKKVEKIANSPLDIEPKTYQEIIRIINKFKRFKLKFNEQQKRELLDAIELSFNDKDSRKIYCGGYNKKQKRLKGAWKEFLKGGLSFDEIKVLHDKLS